MNVKESEKNMMELFPDVAGEVVVGQAAYTSNIPRIDVMLDPKKIGNNPPASGIQIFE
jgi:hypothetical protein